MSGNAPLDRIAVLRAKQHENYERIMKKYILAFKLSMARITAYRLDVVMGRIRNIIALLLLYYVWLTLSAETGTFAGLTAIELTTYVFVASMAGRVVFAGNTRNVSFQINDGTFSTYLVRPVNHFVFTYFEELAERIFQTFLACIEVVILLAILRTEILLQTNIVLLLLFFATLFLAHILYYIMTYAMALISFWSREAMGPRFLFDWFVDFAAGSYFPLHILSGAFFVIATILPFMYLLYAPIMLYLGKLTAEQGIDILFVQLFFITLFGTLANLLWCRGLRHYSGEGI